MEQFDQQIWICKESIQLERGYATGGGPYCDLAGVYAFLGNKEEAYKWLRE